MTKFFNWIQKLGKSLKIAPLFTLLRDNQKLYRLHITLKRYQRTVIKKKIFDTLYYNWLRLYATFIILYFFIPSFTSPIPESLKQNINEFLRYTGFQHFNDATVKYIITTTTNLLVTVLSILSAMYQNTEKKRLGHKHFSQRKPELLCKILI